jgi:hypothetical protein
MKRTVFVIFIVLSILILSVSSAEEMNFYRCINTKSEGFQTFKAKHSELIFSWSDAYYSNASTLSGKLLTNELHSDLLGFDLSVINEKQIIAKGYFLDLSSSELLSNAIAKMVPAIANAVTVDGKLYGLPDSIAFDYWSVDKTGWEMAGLTTDQIPRSFPEFLDFLDAWCDRIEEEPESDLRVLNSWDATVYSSSSYTELLTGILIDNYMMQKDYAGEALVFSEEELLPLLERAQSIGKRLYEAEPAIQVSDESCGYSLFTSVTRPIWPEDSSLMVSMRINDDQPQIVRTLVSVMVVNAATNLPDECIELLELMSEYPDREQYPYLCINGEPVENANYESSVASTKEHIETTEKKLEQSDLDDDEREELENDLASYQKVLASMEDQHYTVSPEQLADYQQHQDLLYVATPGTFSYGTDGYTNLLNLKKQFSAGLLTPSEYLAQLNRLAEMVRLEDAS